MADYDSDGEIRIDSEVLGDRLYAKAQSKLGSRGLFSGDEKYSKSLDYFERAITEYSKAGCMEKAAKASIELAEMYNKYFIEKKVAFGSYHQLSKYYENAGDFTDSFNHTAAVDLWEKSAYYKQSDNNFTGAGALYRRVAGIKEDRGEINGAIKYYDQAAESYFSAGSIVTGAQCRAMKGQLIAKNGDLRRASEVFVDMVKNGQASAEDLSCCFKAQLCIFTVAALRDDYDMAARHDQMLGEICLRWGPSYEHRVIKKLMKAYEQGASGVRAFTKACSEYDTVSTLDEWTTALLVQVKRVMTGKIAPVELDSDSDEADADFKVDGLTQDNDRVLADDDISEFFNFDESMMREIKKDKRSQADIVSSKLL